MTDISKATVEQVIESSIRRGIGSTEPILQIARAQVDCIAELEAALAEAQSQARRYAGHYPQGSDGRNTFLILADHINGLALIPSNPAASGLDVKDV